MPNCSRFIYLVLGSREVQWLGAETVAVAEEEHALAFSDSALGGLDPLAPAGTGPQASDETKGRAQRWNDIVKRMARLADISFAEAAPEGAVQLLVRGEVAALPLKGVIDLSAERARLDKELAKADADIKRVDAKLGNEKFVANAPDEIVEEEKEKREAAVARKEKILEALERLKNAA